MLDLCSSWVSHFPQELEEAAVRGKALKEQENGKKGAMMKEEGTDGDTDANEKTEQEPEHNSGQEPKRAPSLQVLGLGLNAAELSANPILTSTHLQDLNANPTLPPSLSPLAATVCVVSIDYLTRPLAVLSSLRARTIEGGTVHLVVSNRCFPSKAVKRWLRVGERERLKMVGDYLWWSGWREMEVVELCDGRVREGEEGGGGGGGLARLMGMFGGVDPLWVVRGVKVAQQGDEDSGGEKGEL